MKAWYIDNGTLEIKVDVKGKRNLIWYDQARHGDRNVKAPNQVATRLSKLFRNIQRYRDDRGAYLEGLSFPSPQIEADAIASKHDTVTDAVTLAW